MDRITLTLTLTRGMPGWFRGEKPWIDQPFGVPVNVDQHATILQKV